MKQNTGFTLHRLSLGVAAAALVAAAPALATTSLVGPLDGPRAAGPGALQIAYSAQVQQIQRGLNRLGYDAGPTDGLMGSRTSSAIEDYQRDNGLLVTGQPSASLGEHVRQQVSEQRTERRSERQAETQASGNDEVERQTVLQLQSDLRRLGYSVPVVTGRVDSDTAEAIRAYQRDHDLSVDGQASRELVAHVKGRTSAGGGLENRETIRSVQQALNDRGYDAGPADGIMGGKTRDAIRTFQSDAGLPLSGTITQQTVAELGLEAAEQTAAEQDPQTAAPGEPVTVVSDDLTDGDFRRNPRWEVAAGTWSVTDGGALSSEVAVAQQRGDSPRELGTDVIKGILGNALGMQAQEERNLAAIHTRADIGSAFVVTLRLSGAGEPAAFNAGPYQGNNIGHGYRLEAQTGAGEPLQLLAVTGGGVSVIGTTDVNVRLDDGAKHRIDWRRDTNGLQTVELDGEVVLQVRDQAFQDSFDGLSLINAGGTWSVDRVSAQTLSP